MSNEANEEQIDYSQPVAFADIPPAMKKLIADLIDRVYEKVDFDDAEEMCWPLKEFQAGNRQASPNVIAGEMAALLRALIK